MANHTSRGFVSHPRIHVYRITPLRFGSSRRKLFRLIHNKESYRHLNQLCDNQHEHESWGQKPDGSWATAEETAYPWHLARAMALCNLELKASCQALQNKNSHFKQCEQQPCNLPKTSCSSRVQAAPQPTRFVPFAATGLQSQHSQTGVCRECT